MASSPELTGGAGFTFEDATAAIYLAALLTEESAPATNHRVVTRVAQQQAAFGEPLDDLIVDSMGADKSVGRLSLQVKRALTISAVNEDFQEILKKASETLSRSEFRIGIDRVGFVAGTISDASFRAVTAVCEWARSADTAANFVARFEEPGFAGESRREVFESFRTILSAHSSGQASDESLHRLISHFVGIKFDLLHEGSTAETNAIERLRASLTTADAGRASELWASLRTVTRDGAGRAAQFTRQSLLLRLGGAYSFAGARSLRPDVDLINEESRRALATISYQINGIEIERRALVRNTRAKLAEHRFVNIVGLPGTGKSVVLRTVAEEEQQSGPVFVLKSDRLSGPNWAAHARSLGVSTSTIEALLFEIGLIGSPILFIDGIDRVEVQHRGIVLDLMNAIFTSAELENWRVLATSRDNGIEPLRTWVPDAIFHSGVSTVEVGAFDEEESERLAEAQPALRALLFGEERVSEVARRPFFASVLAGLSRQAALTAPSSEVELIHAWWVRGGYNSESSRVLHRQRCLVALAKGGAATLGRRVGLTGLDLDAVRELQSDGIVKEVSSGHAVQFAHDIFFEWSFLHLLIERDSAWLEEIQAVGEPPVLGRTVELLSQSKFAAGDQWEGHLSNLESTPARPQWQRAWLLGPFGVPTFWDRSRSITDAVLRDNGRRLVKLAVWFQAEKTKANPNVLAQGDAAGTRSRADIVRLADALAWPSDLSAWARFCHWVLRNKDALPYIAIPDVVSVFEVWQNALSNQRNRVSEKIVEVVQEWLFDIEDRSHAEELRFERGPWNELERSELKELERRLRSLLLWSTRIDQDRVRNYLNRVIARERLRDAAFGEILQFTIILAPNHAEQLVELTLAELKDELPEETEARRAERGDLFGGSSIHDWHELSIEHKGKFFPTSPLREPFVSLFRVAPDQGRALVRDLTNHAVTAWRQLFRVSADRRATPLPLVLEFRFGRREFWGDQQVYMWSRGHFGSAAVNSGLMALESWAFSEIEGGRNVDDVIQDVVEGHEACSVLNIAVALAMSTNRVSAVTLPLATSQKLWEWDLHRVVQDGPNQANLIGFWRPSDIQHAQAVRAGNERRARRMDIRNLAQLFVLFSDAPLRDAAQQAIRSFPQNLVFTFAEEQNDSARVASLQRRAEIWAEVGNPETYSAEVVDGSSGTVAIRHENPTANDPDVVDAGVRYTRMTEQLTVLNWIWDSFERKGVSDRLSLSEAIRRSRALDRPRLLKEPHGASHEEDMDQSAVVGTSAIAILYAESLSPDDLTLATDVLLRGAATPQATGDVFISSSHIMHHPCLYSARGLPALVRKGLRVSESKLALLGLCGHAYEEISIAALASCWSLWDVDANLGMTALNLGIQISIGARDVKISAYGYDHGAAKARIAKAVKQALREFKRGTSRSSLEALPPAWVHAPWVPWGERRPRRNAQPVWRDPDVFLRWDFLPKLLAQLPIDLVMRDTGHKSVVLGFLYDVLRWVLEKTNPSWADDRWRNEHRSSDIHELKNALFRVLGKVALHIPVDETRSRILEPLFALDDEHALSFVRPLLDIVVAGGILDSPQIVPQACSILALCIDRALQVSAWESARHREGDIYGFDLPDFVTVVLFVAVSHAPDAARFVNGDWSELPGILSVINPFIRGVGDIPHVASSFLTLCERSGEHYPAPSFVEQVIAILNHQEGTPTGWRHTTTTSRIASLIHSFAERTQPLPMGLAQGMLRILDRLVDMGDRRSAALETSEIFKNVRL